MSSKRHTAALGAALALLDRVLGAAVDASRVSSGPATLLDPWRGMHLTESDVRSVLARMRMSRSAKTTSHRRSPNASGALRASPACCRWYRSTPSSWRRLLIVVAPDLDLRYERIYGYLQDDIGRKRPAIDLLANLLCTGSVRAPRVPAALSTPARC
jgi:hypothetical protein